MSLLLDALKKAAKDKQLADADSNADQQSSGQDNQADENTQIESAEELEALEYSVDDSNEQNDQTHIEHAEQEYSESEYVESEQETQTQGDGFGDEIGDETREQPLSFDSGKTSTTTVSDEALQMLIFKTNNEHRRTQKILLTSAIMLAGITLLLGGLYFYSTMLDDVESLERKHKIAILSVRAHEVKTRKPRASVSASVSPSVSAIKNKSMAMVAQSSAPVVNTRAKKVATANRSAGKQADKVINFRKTSKINPVSELLTKAWSAYQRGDYSTAESAYTKVLQQEANNRDGLLGMGAIAMKKGEMERARAAYVNLLQLDPRDPIANAALVNLEKAQTGTLTESKLKFMLQQQPDAPHLHFALGNIYAQQQLWPQAQKSYFNAWQGENKNADYAFNLAVSLDQISEKEQALRFYKDCLKLAQGQNISFTIEAVEARISQLESRV